MRTSGGRHGNNRDKVGGIFFVLHMVGHIVDTFLAIQYSLHKVVIGIVVNDEFNLGEVALTIGEQLGQFNAVGV